MSNDDFNDLDKKKKTIIQKPCQIEADEEIIEMQYDQKFFYM